MTFDPNAMQTMLGMMAQGGQQNKSPSQQRQGQGAPMGGPPAGPPQPPGPSDRGFFFQKMASSMFDSTGVSGALKALEEAEAALYALQEEYQNMAKTLRSKGGHPSEMPPWRLFSQQARRQLERAQARYDRELGLQHEEEDYRRQQQRAEEQRRENEARRRTESTRTVSQ